MRVHERASFCRESFVAAPPASVWDRVSRPEGVNHELMPVMRMSVPRELRGVTLDDVPVGVRVCRSWLLLFGFLPFDYDDLVIAEREPDRRFRETSTMLSMRIWVHERTLEPRGDGTIVRDRISFGLRPPLDMIPGLHRVLAAMLGALFAHRHRRLRRWYATAPPA